MMTAWDQFVAWFIFLSALAAFGFLSTKVILPMIAGRREKREREEIEIAVAKHERNQRLFNDVMAERARRGGGYAQDG
ncbi:hypothetical protein GS464_29450 [Rhodococcus hoagii]|nr:hypothetical protein [Prescottella equi]